MFVEIPRLCPMSSVMCSPTHTAAKVVYGYCYDPEGHFCVFWGFLFPWRVSYRPIGAADWCCDPIGHNDSLPL